MSLFLSQPNKAYDEFHNRMLMEAVNIVLGTKKDEVVIDYGDSHGDYLPFEMQLSKHDLINMITGTRAIAVSYNKGIPEGFPSSLIEFRGGHGEHAHWNKNELYKFSVNRLLELYKTVKNFR